MAAAGFSRTTIGLALLAASCTSVAMDQHSLSGTHWTVTAINGHPTPGSGRFTMDFAADSFSARMGCNSARGSYRVEGGTIHPGMVASTRMACDTATDEAGISPMTFEAWGFAILGKPMAVAWKSGNEVMLANSAGSITLLRRP